MITAAVRASMWVRHIGHDLPRIADWIRLGSGFWRVGVGFGCVRSGLREEEEDSMDACNGREMTEKKTTRLKKALEIWKSNPTYNP